MLATETHVMELVSDDIEQHPVRGQLPATCDRASSACRSILNRPHVAPDDRVAGETKANAKSFGRHSDCVEARTKRFPGIAKAVVLATVSNGCLVVVKEATPAGSEYYIGYPQAAHWWSTPRDDMRSTRPAMLSRSSSE